MTEQVTLVDDNNHKIGFADKDTIHSQNTPLHRGFSLFLFNSRNELLLTQRAKTKKTFPGVWTNSVCGHPAPNESNADAARRRLEVELGLTVDNIKEVVTYRYRFADQNGTIENEICPILVAFSDVKPHYNPSEVMDMKFLKWQEFLEQVKLKTYKYSPWCMEEALILEKKLAHAFKNRLLIKVKK